MKLFILLLMAVCSCGFLKADAVTYNVTPNAGEFLYQFTMTNTGDTGGTLFDLFLSVPTDIGNIDTPSIGTPVGWGEPTGGLLFFGPDVNPGTSFLEWSSDFSGAYDVAIGNSLAGFSFNSSVDIGQPILFALDGTSDFDVAQDTSGSTVPEPASMTTMLLVTLLCAAIAGRKRHV